MVIRARYPGKCSVCGRAVAPGQEVEWNRQSRSVAHVECVAKRQEATQRLREAEARWGLQDLVLPKDVEGLACAECGEPLATPNAKLVRVARRQVDGHREYRHLRCAEIARLEAGYPVERTFTGRGYKPGEAFYDERLARVLVAVRCEFVPANEDLDEFEDRWEVEARLATAEEAAPVLAEVQARRAREDAERRRKALARQIREQGECPAGWHTPDGERITDRQNIYGGGDWFVVGPEHVWYVLNNGADGDNWAVNNVRTGGAGAIGWRVPRTEELVRELLEIEAVLDPEAAERRNPSPKAVFDRYFAEHVDAAVWSDPVELARTPAVAWVRLGGPVVGSIDAQGRPWLAIPVEGAHKRFNLWHSQIAGQDAVALRFEPTTERLAAIRAALPDWADPDVVARTTRRGIVEEEAKRRAEAETLPNWREIVGGWDQVYPAMRAAAEAALVELYADAPPARPGRYHIPGEIGGGWAGTDRDAIWQAIVAHCPLQDVQVELGPAVVHATAPHATRPFAVWSDGVATTGRCDTTATSLAEDAARLLGVALRQEWWRQQGRWRTLLTVEAIEEQEEVERYESARRSSGEGVVLERLAVRHQDGSRRTLWRVTETWWAVGEDGDVGDEVDLYDDEERARRAYLKARHGIEGARLREEAG